MAEAVVGDRPTAIATDVSKAGGLEGGWCSDPRHAGFWKISLACSVRFAVEIG